jgi:hypothetical protein
MIDPADGDELQEVSARLVTPAEMAEIMQVGEDDVLEWIADGHLDSEPATDGAPCVRISETRYEDEGPLRQWQLCFRTSGGAEFHEELGRRRRAHQRQSGDPGGVDVDALTDALAARLKAVAPRRALVTIQGTGFILVGDRPGTGAGIGVSPAAPSPSQPRRTDAERVRGVVQDMLETVQDEFAEISTDPWPVRGPGAMPDPHAELTPDGATIRLWYGDSTEPVLELEPLRVGDVLRPDATES